jgi:hypothetical protein
VFSREIHTVSFPSVSSSPPRSTSTRGETNPRV